MAALTTEALPEISRLLGTWGETVDGDLTATQLTGGRSNLTYTLSDGSTRWILRRPPAAGLTPSAHDIGREFRIAKALAGTDVPVARSIGWCDDTSLLGAVFSVTEFVDGRNVKYVDEMSNWNTADAQSCAIGLVDTLAVLHRVDLDEVGLADLGGPTDFAVRQVKRWTGQWARLNAGTDANAEKLLSYLHESAPQQKSRVLTHGDYRIDNCLLSPMDEAQVLAVIDWELSTTGEPASDVALMAAYRHPALNAILGGQAAWADSRFPGPPELAELYEAATDTSLQDWEFYLALAYFKIAVIARGIAHRHERGAGDEGHASAGDAVGALMAAGLEVTTS